jgi:PleD family two-component response regulator
MMSVGYATRKSKDRSIEEMLKEADGNMYKEKLQNRQAFRELFDNVISRE